MRKGTAARRGAEPHLRAIYDRARARTSSLRRAFRSLHRSPRPGCDTSAGRLHRRSHRLRSAASAASWTAADSNSGRRIARRRCTRRRTGSFSTWRRAPCDTRRTPGRNGQTSSGHARRGTRRGICRTTLRTPRGTRGPPSRSGSCTPRTWSRIRCCKCRTFSSTRCGTTVRPPGGKDRRRTLARTSNRRKSSPGWVGQAYRLWPRRSSRRRGSRRRGSR